ncbi:MAG: response regulator transcription factor [Actinomycetota bacterium]
MRAVDDAVAAICEASTARWHAGEHERALALVTDPALRASASASASARARVANQAAIFSNMLARFRSGLAYSREAREMGVEAGLPEEACRALIYAGQARVCRGDAEGLILIERARGEAQRGAGQRNETLSLICASHVLLPLGRPREAADAARAGIERAIALGVRDHELVLRSNLGDALIATGNLEEGRRQIELASEGWRALRAGIPSPSDPSEAMLLLARGDIDNALLGFHGLSASTRLDRMEFSHVLSLMSGHALAALSAGHPAEARAVVDAALAAWRSTDDRIMGLPLLAIGAQAGDGDRAAQCVGQLQRIARETGMPFARALARKAAAHVDGRTDGGKAFDGFQDAARECDSIGMVWWAAQATMHAGLSDVEADRGAAALLDARARFESMGADGWRLRCEAALRAAGRRIPSRGAIDARGELTAREMEVLLRLADGLTNRQIGERLFISERTVARHLIQVFSKLGVTSRTAAVHAAREAGLLEGATGGHDRDDARGAPGGGVVVLAAPAAPATRGTRGRGSARQSAT